MSIVQVPTQTALVAALSSLGITGAVSLARDLRKLFKALPDIRDVSKSRSSFERKVMPPRQKNKGTNTVGSNRGANAQLKDVSMATSMPGGNPQRSLTSSRPLGVSSGRRGGRVPRSIYTDKISICLRGQIDLANTAAFQCVRGVALGINTGVVDQLSVPMPQIAALGNFFREWRMSKLTVDFVPLVASTVTGACAIAVDRDPHTGAPASLIEVIRRDPFVEVDIKQSGTLTWNPIDAEDRRYRYSIQSGRPIEFLSHGSLIVASANDQAIGQPIGRLFLNAWFEFAVPY